MSNNTPFAFDAYRPAPTQKEVDKELEKIGKKLSESAFSFQILKDIVAFVDITSLSYDDSDDDILALVDDVNGWSKKYPHLSLPAALCVYPVFVPLVKQSLSVASVRIAAVVGAFPAAQTFLDVKVAEAALSVYHGADEADICISLGKFLSGAYADIFDEVYEVKGAMSDKVLKVILETARLESFEEIRKAAILAMEAGADMIKTSTGKNASGATPEAVYVMCKTVKEYYEKSGRKVGIKVAGGVKTPEDALRYYMIVGEVLGQEWLTPNYFRIGSSSLHVELLKY